MYTIIPIIREMKCFHSDSASVHFRTCCHLRHRGGRRWRGWGWGWGGEAGGSSRGSWRPSRGGRPQAGAAVVVQVWFNQGAQREQHGLEQSEPCECTNPSWVYCSRGKLILGASQRWIQSLTLTALICRLSLPRDHHSFNWPRISLIAPVYPEQQCS